MALWEGAREKWVKHYASSHRILLVGEGDFSFALCLALSFGSGSNIVATSLDSYEVVINKYKRGYWNLQHLKMFGAKLFFGVDATKMKDSAVLANWRFDRIVYNFPHAGFHGKEDSPDLIRMHQNLVEGFFHNAAEMLQPYGQIHVSHKTSAPFCDWNIKELAFRNSLLLLDCVDFYTEDYCGYDHKRGDGSKADDPFPLGECSTYKFVLKPRWVKFNICVAMGEASVASCGGVLIDDDRIRFVFSARLGIMEFEVAELCAFKFALRKLLGSRLFGKRPVIIRSNSYLVVSWVSEPNIRPMNLQRHFIEIDSMLNMAYDFRIELIDREDNRAAEFWAWRAIRYGAFEADL